jgi:hypothetical protein
VEIAGLTEAEERDASLLRSWNRDRPRYQSHALLREEATDLEPPENLKAAHAAALEGAVCRLGSSVVRMPRVPAAR